jgi:putative transposase
MQYLKGKTSRKLQMEYESLKKRYWGRHLWAVGYFVRTSGNVTDEVIKAYVENQDHDDKFGSIKVVG